MAKSLFLMILSGIVSLLNPGSFLTATDMVISTDIDSYFSADFSEQSNLSSGVDVKTIAAKSEKVESSLDSSDASKTISTESGDSISSTVIDTAKTKKPETPASEPKSASKSASKKSTVSPTQNYTVTRYIGSVDEYSRTFNKLSYNDIYKFRKMIYGHNSSNLLGNLSSRYVGEVIRITEGGVTKNYKVAAVTTYIKSDVAKLMNKIAYSAMGHDVAFLTCAGRALGQGDATHRLVVLADAI